MSWLLRALYIFGLLQLSRTICPESFTGVGDKCYLIPHLKANWTNADRFCSDLNSHLVVFKTQLEVDLLTAHLHRLNMPLTGTNDTNWWINSIWTSIKAKHNSREFIVQHTGQPIPYPMWGPGQPDHDIQSCVATCKLSDKMVYHDYNCGSELSFICMADGNKTHRLFMPENIFPINFKP